MKIKFFLQLIILSFAFFWMQGAFAEVNITKEEVFSWANKRGEELINALSEEDLTAKYQKLDSLFGEYVDSEYIARFAVGKYWPKFTPNEQKQYQTLFRDYILGLYKTYPLRINRNNISYRVYRVEIKDNNRAAAYITINRRDVEESDPLKNIIIELEIKKDKGEKKLTDVKIAESSLLQVLRGKFYKILAQNDGEVSWFLEDLSAMVKSLKEQAILETNEFEDENIIRNENEYIQ